MTYGDPEVDYNELRNFRWSYQLLLAFAKYILQHDPLSIHVDCEWEDLIESSQAIYLERARNLAGIDHDEYLAGIRNGSYHVSDLYYSEEGDE